MNAIEQDVVNMLQKLTPINKSIVAAEIKRAYQIEQAVKRQYGLDQNSSKQANKSA